MPARPKKALAAKWRAVRRRSLLRRTGRAPSLWLLRAAERGIFDDFPCFSPCCQGAQPSETGSVGLRPPPWSPGKPTRFPGRQKPSQFRSVTEACRGLRTEFRPFSRILRLKSPASLCPQNSVSRTTRWRGRSDLEGVGFGARIGKRRSRGDRGRVVTGNVGDDERDDARRPRRGGEPAALDPRQVFAQDVHIGDRRAARKQRRVDRLFIGEGHRAGGKGHERPDSSHRHH